MASEKLLDTMKIKEKNFFHAKMTTYSKWGCIGLLKSKLTERQQQKIRGTCFGHFLDVNEICFTVSFVITFCCGSAMWTMLKTKCGF